jgi:hypothetical protein
MHNLKNVLGDYPGMVLEIKNLQTLDNPGLGYCLIVAFIQGLSAPEDGENSFMLRQGFSQSSILEEAGKNSFLRYQF